MEIRLSGPELLTEQLSSNFPGPGERSLSPQAPPLACVSADRGIPQGTLLIAPPRDMDDIWGLLLSCSPRRWAHAFCCWLREHSAMFWETGHQILEGKHVGCTSIRMDGSRGLCADSGVTHVTEGTLQGQAAR